MSEFDATLGKRLGALRSRAEISQEIVAKALKLPRPAISQIERGEREVSAAELVAYAKLFGLAVESILDPALEPDVTLGEMGGPKKWERPRPTLRINVPRNNLRKFREVLLYILDKVGSKPNIGETVIYKLLYFIDFDFYERYEEQLIGAQYQKNHYGPTPVAFRKIVERMVAAGEMMKVKSQHFQYPQTKYLPLRKPDISLLTTRELTLIDNVLDRLSEKNAREISDYSHGDVPWRTAADGAMLEYEAVFYRTPPYSVREYRDDVP